MGGKGFNKRVGIRKGLLRKGNQPKHPQGRKELLVGVYGHLEILRIKEVHQSFYI